MEETDGPSLPSVIAQAGLALVPGIGGALAILWAEAQDRDRRRVRQMGEAARDKVNDDERFVQRLMENERLVDLLVEAAEAARRSSWEAKRTSMGRVVAQAVIDDAEIDDSAETLNALIGLVVRLGNGLGS
jgi:hypothetical protein